PPASRSPLILLRLPPPPSPAPSPYTTLFRSQGNLIGVVGTSPTTGCTYHAVGSARLAANTPGPTPFFGTYEIIPPPSCEHTTVQEQENTRLNTSHDQNPDASFFTFNTL